jgi:hypothetical protein
MIGIILFAAVVLFEVNLLVYDIMEKRITQDAERRITDARIRKAESIAFRIGNKY